MGYENNATSLRVAVALGLITLLGPAAVDMYLPSLPVMAQALGADYATVQLSLTVFLLAMGMGQLAFGPVIDAYGRRRPLLVAIILFSVAALWAAMAQSVESLILARTFQGLAAAMAIVTAMSSVGDVAKGAAATKLFALLMTIQGLGPVLAPALGGVIGASLGWRAVFFVLAGLGGVVLLTSVLFMRETLSPEKRLSLNAASVVRGYIDILSDRRFVLPGLAMSFVFFFLFGYIGGAAYVYQKTYGLSEHHFGLVFGTTGLAVLIGAIGCARLVSRFRIERLAVAGVMLILVGASIGLISTVTGIGLAGIAAGMFIALLGLGTAEATLMSIALATRNTALGASAALLGAFPLMLGAVATPLAAGLAEMGAVEWLAFLVLSGLIAVSLTLASARMVARNGLSVSLQH